MTAAAAGTCDATQSATGYLVSVDNGSPVGTGPPLDIGAAGTPCASPYNSWIWSGTFYNYWPNTENGDLPLFIAPAIAFGELIDGTDLLIPAGSQGSLSVQFFLIPEPSTTILMVSGLFILLGREFRERKYGWARGNDNYRPRGH